MKTTFIAKWTLALEKLRQAQSETSIGEMVANPVELTNILDEISSIVDEQRDVLKTLSIC